MLCLNIGPCLFIKLSCFISHSNFYIRQRYKSQHVNNMIVLSFWLCFNPVSVTISRQTRVLSDRVTGYREENHQTLGLKLNEEILVSFLGLLIFCQLKPHFQFLHSIFRPTYGFIKGKKCVFLKSVKDANN